MSVHDAHRAFQQVPPSPPSSRTAPSPPQSHSGSSHSTRPTSQSVPHLHPNARPFQPYSTSQSPTLGYAQPYPVSSPSPLAPRPLPNGHAQSPQHVWMPLSPTPPHAQASYYRPPPAPYTQVLPYSSSAPMAPGYSPMSKTANGAPVLPIGRGRTMPGSHLVNSMGTSGIIGSYPNNSMDQSHFPGRTPQMSPPHIGYPPSPVPVYGVAMSAGRGVPTRAATFDPHSPGVYNSVPSTPFRTW